MTSEEPRPLFVTRFSLSDTTAIGVQTKYLMPHFKSWTHAYWSANEFKQLDRRSYPLEALPFRRFSFLKRDNVISRTARALGFSWWPAEGLSPAVRRALRLAKSTANCLYLAPLDEVDASRMRQLAEWLELPFVVHLWDFLSGPPVDPGNSNLRWLLSNAAWVGALTPSLANDAQAYNEHVGLLLFTRETTPFRAKIRADGQPFRIALIGDVISYLDGVELLLDAVRQLEKTGTRLSVEYIGPASVARRLRAKFGTLIHYVGFFSQRADRDASLAGFHLGFLPGPHKDPNLDTRSKYSVPSRVLDYLAVGLPVLGCAHPRSAAAVMSRSLGLLDSDLLTSDAISSRLEKLINSPATWAEEGDKSAQSFLKSKTTEPSAVLDTIFRAYCVGHSEVVLGNVAQ